MDAPLGAYASCCYLIISISRVINENWFWVVNKLILELVRQIDLLTPDYGVYLSFLFVLIGHFLPSLVNQSETCAVMKTHLPVPHLPHKQPTTVI